MSYVVLLEPGTRWWPRRPTLDQGQPIEQHVSAMRRLAADGLLLGGGTLDRSGAVALLDTSDPVLARALMTADPAIARGVLRARLLRVEDYVRPALG